LTTDRAAAPLYRRRSLRLPDYDYASAGAYFVTICAFRRQLLFEDAEVARIILEEWQALAARFPSVALDEFVIMPNHLHLSSGWPNPT
jgi:REP element-mobilizing transposase RayT